MISPERFPSSARTSVSLRRKPSSPSVEKICGIEQPAAFSISASASTHSRPSAAARSPATVDFPEPGIMFRDITTVLNDAEGFRLAIDEMEKLVEGLEFDVILGAGFLSAETKHADTEQQDHKKFFHFFFLLLFFLILGASAPFVSMTVP
jgi:hypothetical protein